MKIKFKYNVGDTVKLINVPSFENMALGKYILKNEFSPKEYKISKCKCTFRGNNVPKIVYNLYAYCDEYIQYHNWIPENELEGPLNEHEEDVEFISHDKETLFIGDTVLSDAFYGDYEKPYMSPCLTFTYAGTILGFDYEISENGQLIKKTAILERNDGTTSSEFTPYLVKNINKTFVYEYVEFCKKKKFNPIKEAEKFSSYHRKLLEEIHLWDDVVEIYTNWNKVKPKTAKKNYTRKKYIKSNPLKSDIKKLLKSLSEQEKEKLKKELLKI